MVRHLFPFFLFVLCALMIKKWRSGDKFRWEPYPQMNSHRISSHIHIRIRIYKMYNHWWWWENHKIIYDLGPFYIDIFHFDKNQYRIDNGQKTVFLFFCFHCRCHCRCRCCFDYWNFESWKKMLEKSIFGHRWVKFFFFFLQILPRTPFFEVTYQEMKTKV